jgi:multicomponent K+:H+ antiporter subunit E
MKWLLPYPLLSACLLAMWLLLNQSVSIGQLLLGSLMAVLGGWLMTALQPARSRVSNPGAIVRLAGLVISDIVRSNIAVAQIILGPRRSDLTSGFVHIPLDLRNRYGLAILASIITSTPGTLWVGFNSNSGTLLIHVLDLVDESAWIELIKRRYERLLLEIFE